jgi:hypothetical protein
LLNIEEIAQLIHMLNHIAISKKKKKYIKSYTTHLTRGLVLKIKVAFRLNDVYLKVVLVMKIK